VNKPQPALQIVVSNDGKFEFTLASQPPVVIQSDWSGWPDLSSSQSGQTGANKTSLSRIEQFSLEAGDSLFVDSLAQAGRAMDSLIKTGQLWTEAVFNYHNLPRVEEIMRRAIDEVFPGTTPLIMVTARPQMMPAIESLPLLRPDSRSRTYGNMNDLLRAARVFVGFSAVVARSLPDGEIDSSIGPDSDKLNIRAFLGHRMPGACLEHKFFDRNKPSVAISAPWTHTKAMSQEVVQSDLAEQLWGDGSLENQFHHFACHCNTESNNANAHQLKLVLRGGQEVSIELETLRTMRRNLPLKIRQRIEATKLPMVILNACNSGQVNVFSPTSFPKFFLHTAGNRGFIGTEATVPDRFAAAFSQEFYRLLLTKMRIGEALLQTRLNMLKKYRNPLGILYTFYGDPTWQPSCRAAVAEELGESEFLQERVRCIYGKKE